MSLTPERLYQLLPAIYHVRDAQLGEPLKALVALLADQGAVLEEDIEQLYDNWFIETCEEWVVPYIGDLLGVRGLHTIDTTAFTQRAYVANTLRYRRRKGTATMLEQLARDTTGWNARAVEFFQLLEWTQHYNHVRAQNFRTPDLRRTNELEMLDTAFDTIAHTVDVRHIASARGRHNISNVGIFLWRLQSYFLSRTDARALAAADGRFVFNPLGLEYPLFNRPKTETDIAHLAEEINVPGGLRARPLYDELEARRQAIVDLSPTWELSAAALDRLGEDGVPAVTVAKLAPLLNRPPYQSEQDLLNDLNPLLTAAERTQFTSAVLGRALRLSSALYFDAEPAFEVFVQPNAGDSFVRVPPEEVMICYLDAPPATWARPPATKDYTPSSGAAAQTRAIRVGVDPVRGRIAFPGGVVPNAVQVSYAYGFSGDIGGGPYDRRDSMAAIFPNPQSDVQWQVGVSKSISAVPGEIFNTIADALAAWQARSPGVSGLIAIMDNRIYVEDLNITVPEGSSLVIAAANWPQVQTPMGPKRFPGQFDLSERRAHLLGKIKITGTAPSASLTPGKLLLNGLLVEGDVIVTALSSANLGELRIEHCTIVPAIGALKVNGGNDMLKLRVVRSICGRIALPLNVPALFVSDSIVDGAIAAPGAEFAVEQSTLFGTVTVKELAASNCVLVDLVTVERKQTGCVRFCSLPQKSQTPRRFRCQPDLALTGVALPQQAAVRARVTPLFTSTTYGEAAYAQLSVACPAEIRTGADDGGEMGAFNFLKQAQRETNLRSSLDEYLRFGLEAGLIFAT